MEEVWSSKRSGQFSGYSFLCSDRIAIEMMQKRIWDDLTNKHFGDTGKRFDLDDKKRTPESIEAFLAEYLGKPIELLMIGREKDTSNGFPVWVFFFISL